MPTSTPNGMVSGSTGGIAQRNSCSTVWSRRVAAAHQHLEQLVDLVQEDDEGGQQRAQHRAGQDLAKYVAAQQAHSQLLTRHLRRRHHRQLGQFFFHRMQFQIVDQDRGRHHAGLRA